LSCFVSNSAKYYYKIIGYDMKQCPKCNTEHEKSGLYCSRSCANSREWSKEINESRSAKLAGRTAVRSNPEQWKKI
jgi:hypothetical protein